MKKNYFVLLFVAALVYSASITQAQNCGVRNNNALRSSIEIKNNQWIQKINEHLEVAISLEENNMVLDPGKAVHQLSIVPEGDWEMIVVVNEEGFRYNHYFWDGPLSLEVTEGIYDVMVYGGVTMQCYPAFLSLEQIEVITDTNLTPSMDEATNCIYTNALDENGNSLENVSVIGDYDIHMNYVMLNGICSAHICSSSPEYNNESPVYFNNFGDHISLYTNVLFATENQTCYAIDFPVITDGMTGNVQLTNESNHFKSFEEFYNIDNSEQAYFYCAYFGFGPKPDSYKVTKNFIDTQTMDPSLPLTIKTNFVVNDEPLEDGNSDMNFMVAPIVFESVNNSHTVDFYNGYVDAVAPFAMALNSDGQIVREPVGEFIQSSEYETAYPNCYPYTPAMYLYEPSKSLTFGYRTPILYYQPANYNNENSPMGMPFFGGTIGFLGEQGLQRMKDEDNNLQIIYNGEEYFNDSLYLANNTFMFMEEPGTVEYNIVDDNLIVDGIAKTNITNIQFDVTRTDAMPPTLTLLQVMNAANEEVVVVENLNDSKINFAAGNYHIDIDLMQIIYDDPATVQAYYKTENTDYQAFEYTEDVSMFHNNYGNYYIIDLAQLEGKVNNQWVSIKFILTDDAGNSQTQELSNVFFAGDLTSVTENGHALLKNTVYPNPFNGTLTINTTEPINGTAIFNVFNSVGEMVYTNTMNCIETYEFQWNADNMATGIYLYNITTENGTIQGCAIKK